MLNLSVDVLKMIDADKLLTSSGIMSTVVKARFRDVDVDLGTKVVPLSEKKGRLDGEGVVGRGDFFEDAKDAGVLRESEKGRGERWERGKKEKEREKKGGTPAQVVEIVNDVRLLANGLDLVLNTVHGEMSPWTLRCPRTLGVRSGVVLRKKERGQAYGSIFPFPSDTLRLLDEA